MLSSHISEGVRQSYVPWPMSPCGPFFDGLEKLANHTHCELACFLRVFDLLCKGGLDLELELLFGRFGCFSAGD